MHRKLLTSESFVLRVADSWSKSDEAPVGDSDHPSTVDENVGALQTTVSHQRSLV